MDPHQEICAAIDRYRDHAVKLSHEIHEHPEVRFEERRAAGALSAAARELGLEVTLGTGGLETAFRAEFGKPR
jgi:metal-dependent amidase/aminoacylase/carboxypeptidase family protein